jgi:hypothetical protein
MATLSLLALSNQRIDAFFFLRCRIHFFPVGVLGLAGCGLITHHVQRFRPGPVNPCLAVFVHIGWTVGDLPARDKIEQLLQARDTDPFVMDIRAQAPDPLDIVRGEQSPGADMGRLNQPFILVDPQGAGMNPQQPGRNTDGIHRDVRPHRHYFWFPSGHSFSPVAEDGPEESNPSGQDPF